MRKMVLFKKRFIQQCKQRGVDIILNTQGFNTSYEIYYQFPHPKMKRFSTFSEVEAFVAELFSS